MDLRLRSFRPDDARDVARLAGDEAVSRWTMNIPHPYSEAQARDWIRRSASDTVRNPRAVESSGQLVACVSFWPHESGGVEVGYWVGREFWGCGIATAALRLLLASEGFPGGSDIYARVMLENIGSRRVLEKCGFTLFGDGRCPKDGGEVPALVYVRRPAAGEPG